MPAKPTTNFTGLSVTGNDTNSTNGLYVPKITSAQRDAINLPQEKKLGGIIYNLTTDRFEIFNQSGWVALDSASGGGDVSGPDESTSGSIAYFSDNSGKKLASSGVTIDSISSFNQTTRNVGLELSGLTYLKFASDTSAIYVDALTGIQFIINNFGADSQVCSLLTSGLPSSSSSPNALLEIQSTTGAFLMSRMSSAQRDALIAIDGMILYNTDIKKVEAYTDGAWKPLDGESSSGDVTGPNSSIANNVTVFADASGKAIIDSNISINNIYSAGNPTYFIEKNASFYAGTGTGNSSVDAAGSFNVGVGINVLTNINNGNSNVGVGAQALQNNIANENTAIGCYSLLSNLNGTSNSALGAGSLYNNTFGSFNVAVGVESLNNNVQGSSNTAVGSSSLANNLADANSALGSNSLTNNSTGMRNSALGADSLSNNTTGNFNSAVGANSLLYNSTGTSNSALGAAALYHNTTGNFNSAVGFESLGKNIQGSTNTAVGSSSLANNLADGNSALGAGSLYNNTTGNFNSAVGTNSLFHNSTGTNNSALGAGSLYDNTIGNFNSAVGFESLNKNVEGSNNTAVGSSSLANNLADGNTALGASSLLNNTIGSNNVAVGLESLSKNVQGSNNIAIGSYSLSQNIAGSNNVAIGTSSISYNTDPNNPINGNVAIGWNALAGGADQVEYLSGNYNVAVGYNSLLHDGSGSYNVALGAGSLPDNNSGSYNVAIGIAAGGGAVDCNNCIFIGKNASTASSVSNINNAIAIGSEAIVSKAKALTLGNGHNVGIGNNGATYALDIGLDNQTNPLIRMAPTSIPSAPPNVGDGIYFNNQGQASYLSNNAIYSGNLVNAKSSNSASATCGFIEYLPGNNQGSVTINTASVKSNSIILTTLYSTFSNGPSLTGSAIITNINPGVSFSVQGNYTPNGPILSAFWLIINPS